VLQHQDEFEDTKGAIRIRISKKNRKHNGQKKKSEQANTTGATSGAETARPSGAPEFTPGF
jgi:hypothetical protein